MAEFLDNEKAYRTKVQRDNLFLLDKHDNLLTDPETVGNKYFSEFKHRLRTRDIKTELKWYELFQNDNCCLRVNAAKSNNSPEFSILQHKQVIGEGQENLWTQQGW